MNGKNKKQQIQQQTNKTTHIFNLLLILNSNILALSLRFKTKQNKTLKMKELCKM